MRLWHKDLIPVLPRQQLLGQWRECCLIAKNIAEKGTPGHILVNRIMEYPLEDFYTYGIAIVAEIKKRGYKVTQNSMMNFTKYIFEHDENACIFVPFKQVFFLWHNNRYLAQCLYNLQEKYDCGGIAGEEWAKIDEALKAVPAADVVPVRHGRWIPDEEDIEWGNSLIRYRCSECKERPHFDKEKYKFILSPYCPNCGAKMDGDGE